MVVLLSNVQYTLDRKLDPCGGVGQPRLKLMRVFEVHVVLFIGLIIVIMAGTEPAVGPIGRKIKKGSAFATSMLCIPINNEIKMIVTAAMNAFLPIAII